MTVRVAIIGAGHLGRIHARLLQEHSNARLVAVVDPLQTNRNSLANEYGCQSWSDYRPVLPEFDAAIVATPTLFHHEVACHLLERHIHVFVEKPIATSPSQAKEMVELARKRNCVLQVGHVERFNPAFIVARKKLAKPRFITARRSSGFAFRSTDIGVVLDLMVHDLDLALAWADSPVIEVKSTGFNVLGGHEDTAHAWLRFQSGCVATLYADRVSPVNERSCEAIGDKQIARLDLAAGQVNFLQPGAQWPCTNEDIQAMSTERRQEAQREFFDRYLAVNSPTTKPTNPILDEQTDFISAITNGHEPQVNGEQGCRVIEVAHRILAAMQLHRWNDGDSSQWRKAG